MKSKDIIKEASVMDYEPPRNLSDPAAIKAKEREQALGADPFSQMFTPGVSSVQDIGDVAQGDYSAIPYVALGMIPGIGGTLSKTAKKLFGRGDRAAAKSAFSKEQQRLANLTPAQRQAEKEASSSLRQPPAQPPKAKKGEEPVVKRDEPALTEPKKDYKDLDRPAVQRKEKAAADIEAAKAAERKSQPHYVRDPKTGQPVPANVQAQLQQKLQGKGFKEPEPGTISGFKPKPQQKAPAKEPVKEPAKVEPVKTEPQAAKTLDGKPIKPGFEYNTKTGKWEPSKETVPTLPSARNTPVKQEKSDKKAALGSVGLHAALLAALANMDTEPKKSAAAQSQTTPKGDSEKPMTVNLIDPGSTTASDAAATTKPSTSTAITQPSAANSGEERSLPPVVVTATPEKEKPQKKQPIKVVDPTQKAEEPKADSVATTDAPSTWEVETGKDEERAEADKADDKESAKTTQAVPEPKEDEDEVLEKLRKLLGLDKTVEPKPEPSPEPSPEPAKEPEVKQDAPKAEPEKKPEDKSGKADAEKGTDNKRGDEKEAPKADDKSDKVEKPKSDDRGQNQINKRTDSAVDKGSADSGRDDKINYAPPPAERKYEPDDRATRLRDNLKKRREQELNPEKQEIQRMTPDVNESLDHILGLANITKKEITESTTMNLDMRKMLELMTEASKMADIKGKKHTGKYGKEYDTDEEGEEKDSKAKKAEPAEKKGRGRPKKDSNVEAGKYKGADDAASHIIGGKAPKSKSNLPSKKHTLKDWFDSTEEALNEAIEQLDEKAVSKAQQKFMGMVHAAQKGKKPASKEVAKVAKTMGKKDAKDFASTKHKGLPEKVKEGEKFTSNGKPISKDQYDALRMAAGKTPSPANVKEDEENSFVCVHAKKGKCKVKAKTSYEAAKKAANKWKLKSTAGIDTHRADKPVHVDEAELKGGQKKLDVAEPKGKLDAKDFAKLRAKKKIKEGVNFAEMMKETQMGVEEMLEELQQEIAEFKATGHMGDKLRDAFDIHRHSKNKLMGEAPMISQPMVEEPVEESPFTYAARQAKASGEDSFSLGGETFPVKESQLDEKYMGFNKTVSALKKQGGIENPEGLAANIGRKKYGKKKFQTAAAKGKKLGEDWTDIFIDPEKLEKRRANKAKAEQNFADRSAKHFGDKIGDQYHAQLMKTMPSYADEYREQSKYAPSSSLGYIQQKLQAKHDPMGGPTNIDYEKIKKEPMATKPGEEGVDWRPWGPGPKEYFDSDEFGRPVREDGPGAGRLYRDDPNLRNVADPSQAPMSSSLDQDSGVLDSLKKFANKGIDKWNEFEQGKKDKWDATFGGDSGYIPSKIPKFDTDTTMKNLPKSPNDMNVKMQNMPKRPKDDSEYQPLRKEPQSDIFDREKPYRDPKTGKMVTPPKGLSISEPIDPKAVDINKPRKSMKENFDFSLWDNQLEKMINESLTVSTTQGDDEKDNSVSITASGEKAAEIMALLRNAGMDTMGGQGGSEESVEVEPEQMLSAYGVPMSSDSGSSSSADDMMSLMQKLTGFGSDEDSGEMEIDVMEPEHEEHAEHDSEDYEEEDNDEEEDHNEEDSDEENDSDEEEEVDESYGQTDEGNKFTGNLAKARAAGKDEADLDGDGDMEKVREGEGETCNECGMYEAKCGCDHEDMSENLESARPIEEELANGADDTSMQDIKYLIKTLAGGLNKEKRDQTTLPYTAVKVNESKEMLNEWKKLSGIK